MKRHPEPSAFDSFNDFTVGDLCTFTPKSDTLAQAIGFPRFARPCDDSDFDQQILADYHNLRFGG